MGVDVRKQAAIEHSLFLIRDGHELGRAIASSIPPEEAHLFATGPRNVGEADRLLAQFQTFLGTEAPGTPIDLSLVRFAWSRLGPAQPPTVRNYLSRLMTALADRGVRGVRTRRVQQASQTLRRLSVMIRPGQALPLKTAEAKEVVSRLEKRGQLREAAMVAAVWLSRGRVPDLRVVTADDVTEVENPGASPERVGLQIFLKEKQAKSYNAPEYLPPGVLTAKIVSWARGVPTGPLFAATQAQYDLAMQRVRAALPSGAIMHSFRRGATQELERGGATRTELVDLLRHADPRTTRRYMMRTAPGDIQLKPKQLAPLQ